MTRPAIRAHVFGTYQESLLAKQFPGNRMIWDDVHFTYGTDIPEDIDVLLIHIRASYSIPTRLPRERVVFIAGEPDVIHPYSARFLNQFGLVLTPSDKALDVPKWQTNYASMWFAGVSFMPDGSFGELRGYDWLSGLQMPADKIDKISVVTSDKVHTDYHRKRLVFLDALKEMIPDHLELFGRGTRTVVDKAEALLPYKYHLAMENGGGRDTWTEKLADPLLCWTFPFYTGCTNVDDYIPSGAFRLLDLSNPKQAAADMVQDITSGRWQAAQEEIAKARHILLEDWNLASLFARLARTAFETPVAPGQATRRLIRSERSMRPEGGSRGSLAQWALRRSLLAIDPKIELRSHRLVLWNEHRKAARRRRRFHAKEQQGGAG